MLFIAALICAGSGQPAPADQGGATAGSHGNIKLHDSDTSSGIDSDNLHIRECHPHPIRHNDRYINSHVCR